MEIYEVYPNVCYFHFLLGMGLHTTCVYNSRTGVFSPSKGLAISTESERDSFFDIVSTKKAQLCALHLLSSLHLHICTSCYESRSIA